MLYFLIFHFPSVSFSPSFSLSLVTFAQSQVAQARTVFVLPAHLQYDRRLQLEVFFLSILSL